MNKYAFVCIIVHVFVYVTQTPIGLLLSLFKLQTTQSFKWNGNKALHPMCSAGIR